MNAEIKKELYLQSGLPLIEINEDTEFQKPISINGYDAHNYKELRDMYECNVISLNKFDEIITLLSIGELGVIKKRKKYKELYQDAQLTIGRLRSENNKLIKLFNMIEDIAIKNEYKDILEVLNEQHRKSN